VAHALKPALQELAERSIDEVIQDPEAYKKSDNYQFVLEELEQNLERKLAQHKRRFEQDMKLAEDMYHADNYVAEHEFTVRLEPCVWCPPHGGNFHEAPSN
jgi:hypothetical protein